jgi:hypothetical protein
VNATLRGRRPRAACPAVLHAGRLSATFHRGAPRGRMATPVGAGCFPESPFHSGYRKCDRTRSTRHDFPSGVIRSKHSSGQRTLVNTATREDVLSRTLSQNPQNGFKSASGWFADRYPSAGTSDARSYFAFYSDVSTIPIHQWYKRIIDVGMAMCGTSLNPQRCRSLRRCFWCSGLGAPIIYRRKGAC